MRDWEITKERAIATLTVWTQHAPTLQIGGQDTAALAALMVALGFSRPGDEMLGRLPIETRRKLEGEAVVP